MIGLVDRALALNPSFARGWFVSGILRLWAGQPDLAIEHVETSLRLSPRERMGQPLSVMGMAYFFKRQFDEAAAKLLLAIQDHPGFPASYRVLAACYAHMGRLDEARAIVARLRAITPLVVPSDRAFSQPRGPRALPVGPAPGGGRGSMKPIDYLRCFAGITTREWLRFLNQRGRFFSALVRPLVWLAIFATGFHFVLGVSIIPPYETYIPYEVYIAPG